MEHNKSGQYDDDLTVGIDDYDEDFDAGDVDLFDYVGDEESPLSRLKSIILSIDWEITDDILRQFNEELQELKDLWAGDKIYLIYVQALEKISRYIYKEKSSAHPNAIKLLLAFYTNLEKIVSDDTMSDQETKKLLMGDIERFEKLKKQISPAEQAAPDTSAAPVAPAASAPEPEELEEPADVEIVEEPVEAEKTAAPAAADADDPLLNLKAIVYGIDWEITERDLKNLGSEVKLLGDTFKSSKAKQIFLQGIGSLGSYINLKRSDAHADAFKLLHSFFVGLETVVRDDLTGQAEKDILLPQVEKFNAFKAEIAETISSDAVEQPVAEPEEPEDEFDDSEIQPAFANVPEDVQGFQEEQESEDLDAPVAGGEAEESIDEYFEDKIEERVVSEGDKALTKEMESRLEGMFDEPGKEAALGLAADVALQGVDVETEADDESDEEPLPEEDGELAPALAAEEPLSDDEESPAVFADKAEEFFEEPEPEKDEEVVIGKDIPGVDVEHEADDDTDEPPLPTADGEIAPAFADEEEKAQPVETADIDGQIDDFFGDEAAVDPAEEEPIAATDDFDEAEFTAPVTTEIDDRVSDFFGDDESQPPPETDDTALAGVDVETDADDEADEEPLPIEDGEFAPALADDGDGEEVEPVAVAEDLEETETAVEPVEEPEEAAIDDRFDQLFADEDEETPVAEEVEEEKVASEVEGVEELAAAGDIDDALTVVEEEVVVDEEQLLQGVDVEHEADDDADEEPLPFEDGELAPALAADEDVSAEVEAEDELEEAIIGDKFDAVFGDDEVTADFESDIEITEPEVADADEFVSDIEIAEPEVDETEVTETEVAETEELVTEEDFDFDSEDVEETLLADDATEAEVEFAPEEAVEDTSEFTAFEEAGFEEIVDEEIEEIPEEAFVTSEEDELLAEAPEDDLALEDISEEEVAEEDVAEDEIMALLGDDADSDTLFAEEPEEFAAVLESDEVAAALAPQENTLEDDEIAEVSVDELATVLSQTDGITATGDVPSGYPTTDELLSGFGEVAGDESEPIITHPEDNMDYIVGVEGLDEEVAEEEEVVFEPVAEDDEELFPESDVVFNESSTFGTTLLTDDVDLLRQDETVADEAEEDAEVAFADIPEDTEEVELTAETAAADTAYRAVDADAPTDDSLVGLRNCIVSLGLEIDDGIINSLNEEIATLRQSWLDKPAEKTFIQLLSTVSAHIDKYRYEADQEANKLLLSIFDKLELCALGQTEDAQIQEAILNETSKVLQWQTRLIERAPAVEEVADESGAPDTVVEELAPEPEEAAVDVTQDFSEPVEEDVEKKQLMENVSAIMRSEIDQLIQAFQEEIKGLKDEIRQVKDKKD